MSFFQKDIETMPRAELEKLQLEKLKHITKYCYDNVPLYKRKFDEAGFDCTKIKALSDIQYIPYTTSRISVTTILSVCSQLRSKT